MDSPQRRIMQELSNDDGKRFALIINDMPVMVEGRQVYVKSQQSQLVTVIYKKLPNKTITTELKVDLDTIWHDLAETKEFFGFNFSSYFEIDGVSFHVAVNRSFEMLFIESPAITFVKDCIRNAAGHSLSVLNVQGVPYRFWEEFKDNWVNILSKFQVVSALKYINLVARTMKRKIDNKMFLEKNRLFRGSIHGNKVNFLYLFLRTTGLYNPFLEDKQLTDSVRDSWFFGGLEGNNRLYARDGRDYVLHCMTVNDFCRSIGIDIKLGFNSETALLFLFGMLYTGNFNSVDVPQEQMTGFIAQDIDVETGRCVHVSFHSKHPGKSRDSYDREILSVTGLTAFSIRYAITLGGNKLDAKAIANILIDAHFERR